MLISHDQYELIPHELYLAREVLPEKELNQLFLSLKEKINWRQENIRIGAKVFPQPRLIAWHGDEQASYTYSGLTLRPQPWNQELLKIKSRIEEITDFSFNSVLLNFYRDGNDSMGWHSDNEIPLGKNPAIASFNLGGTRKFLIKQKKKKRGERLELYLREGDLLLMQGDFQNKWIHSLPKSKTLIESRINLTFRKISS